MGSKDQGSAKVRVGAREARMSCTRTKPSNQPETSIWSEAPQGDVGGAEAIPYTAVGPSQSKSLFRWCSDDDDDDDDDDKDAPRTTVGVGEMEVGVTEWMARGVSEEVPKAAKGVDAVVERSADQARVSKSIIALGREEAVWEDKARRQALPLLERDKRLSPEAASASIKSSL
jgi:hypothetical protein